MFFLELFAKEFKNVLLLKDIWTIKTYVIHHNITESLSYEEIIGFTRMTWGECLGMTVKWKIDSLFLNRNPLLEDMNIDKVDSFSSL